MDDLFYNVDSGKLAVLIQHFESRITMHLTVQKRAKFNSIQLTLELNSLITPLKVYQIHCMEAIYFHSVRLE